MRIITSVTAMQQLARRWRRQNLRVGLVPTMGYLHEGHLSLVRRARRQVGVGGQVVVSIYVNPTQFAPHEDLRRYPRDLARDKKLCRGAGVDVLFVPDDAGMYPGREGGGFSTGVVEERLSQGMEGAARPAHFRGVATVVAKLFNLVLPEVAVFGAKDYQQAAVIQRMVRDLNFPVTIVVAPTVREPDGLAMSSRNQYLNPRERQAARVLKRALDLVRGTRQAHRAPLPAQALKKQVVALVQSEPLAGLDYVEFFDPATLQPVARVRLDDRMALAVWIGKTRLIDNG